MHVLHRIPRGVGAAGDVGDGTGELLQRGGDRLYRLIAFQIRAFLRRDVAGVFGDAGDFAIVVVFDRIGGLQPDVLPLLADAAELSGLDLSAVEGVPEIFILLRLHVGTVAEHAVVLALDFLQRITGGFQEILVGVENRAVWRKVDESLDLVERVFGFGDRRGDIAGDLDDFVGFAVGTTNRVVGGLDPDFFPIISHALVLRGLEFALAQVVPERLVFFAFGVFRLDEHAVMLADDVFAAVAHGVQEILVGPLDFAGGIEMDDGLAFVECRHDVVVVGIAALGDEAEHGGWSFVIALLLA